MAFNKRIEFGNYTLKFGDEKVLLDLIGEVVVPSFGERRYIRRIKDKGEYFFLDVGLAQLRSPLNEDAFAVVGRIVKNAKVSREQYFEAGGIVADKKELETAPTSLFVLLLDTHRLIFCREMSGAPTIQNFESTSQNFLLQRHKEFIEERLAQRAEALGEEVPRGTKAALLREFPRPDLRITPLSDKQSLEEFINRFRSIDELTIKLLPTNKEEIDNDDFWADFGRRKDSMRSTSATVRFSNGNDGLEPKEVVAQTAAATGMGNSSVKIKGHDDQGDSLKGNHEDFSLTVEIEDLPKDAKQAAQVLYANFANLAHQGVIALPVLAAGVLDKVRAYVDGRV